MPFHLFYSLLNCLNYFFDKYTLSKSPVPLGRSLLNPKRRERGETNALSNHHLVIGNRRRKVSFDLVDIWALGDEASSFKLKIGWGSWHLDGATWPVKYMWHDVNWSNHEGVPRQELDHVRQLTKFGWRSNITWRACILIGCETLYQIRPQRRASKSIISGYQYLQHLIHLDMCLNVGGGCSTRIIF